MKPSRHGSRNRPGNTRRSSSRSRCRNPATTWCCAARSAVIFQAARSNSISISSSPRTNHPPGHQMNTESMNSLEFAGQRVLVTGGTKGAGEAMVRRFAAAGARVATTARAATCPEGLPCEVYIPADVATPAGAETVAQTVLERLGGVDVLINNVGGSAMPPVASRSSPMNLGGGTQSEFPLGRAPRSARSCLHDRASEQGRHSSPPSREPCPCRHRPRPMPRRRRHDHYSKSISKELGPTECACFRWLPAGSHLGFGSPRQEDRRGRTHR